MVGLLGAVHVALTLFTDQLAPTDSALADAIIDAPMNISSAARFGRAVKGFNLSHSIAALLFAAVYLPLAIREPEFLDQVYVQALGAITLIGFTSLAWRYWFAAPLFSLAGASTLYGVGMIGILS